MDVMSRTPGGGKSFMQVLRGEPNACREPLTTIALIFRMLCAGLLAGSVMYAAVAVHILTLDPSPGTVSAKAAKHPKMALRELLC
ncbi:hypothetical protein [Paraburkholderia strydomiana]|uniref:hypothetical protein n=1 Tax=Paraburkholderia strydomiana TaxID=1245417 RepID=UPI00285FE20F|nr:hypothetical protein [Paraburkholderia strydomiana]MDR7006176.1 hypothetical protein [Paraburkholderia strydomiana]